MEKRIGVITILVDNRNSIPKINEILSNYHDFILARQGLPIKEKNISVISIIIEGSTDHIGAISGKLGKLDGVNVKSMITKQSS